MNASAIIVAAGSSQRMGFDKLAAPLAGIPVLQHTFAAFLAADCINEIIIVCPPPIRELLDPAVLAEKNVRFITGGVRRQDSVAMGLAALAPGADYVAVHDGARPLVHPDDIARCVAAAEVHGAASLARRVTETLMRSDADDFNAEVVSRDLLWFMETPQVFKTTLLRDAYAMVAANDLLVTDEVSAVKATGTRVKFIESSFPNPKITRPSDLLVAAAILAKP